MHRHDITQGHSSVTLKFFYWDVIHITKLCEVYNSNILVYSQSYEN